MDISLGGNLPGGNFQAGNCSGGSYAEWELSWVGIFFDGSFPGWNSPMGIIQKSAKWIIIWFSNCNSNCLKDKSSHRRCSIKKLFLKISQCSQENTFVGISFSIKLQVYQKKTPTHVLSFEICEIFIWKTSANSCF